MIYHFLIVTRGLCGNWQKYLPQAETANWILAFSWDVKGGGFENLRQIPEMQTKFSSWKAWQPEFSFRKFSTHPFRFCSLLSNLVIFNVLINHCRQQQISYPTSRLRTDQVHLVRHSHLVKLVFRVVNQCISLFNSTERHTVMIH